MSCPKPMHAGDKFGRLTAVEFVRYANTSLVPSHSYWLFKCDCGNTKEVKVCHARSGHTTSCGCFQREDIARRQTRHGMRDTAEYKVWAQMLQRCNNPNDAKYVYYGARGISVSPEWHDFVVFMRDIGFRPSENYSIHRKDNDGNYTKDNCKWATDEEQVGNKRAWGTAK